VEIDAGGQASIVLDAGSGIRQMAKTHMDRQSVRGEYHVFFSHFHYDHIQGLPFFAPAYLQNTALNFYSPDEGLREILTNHMDAPYFPVTMSTAMRAALRFHVLKGGNTFVGNAEVHFKRLNHPGGAYAYKVVSDGRSVIYATDTELHTADFEKTRENMEFFQDADMVILDAQYTLGEAIEKHSWGHSSYSLGVDFAKVWNIRRLYLFHHEPQYDDRQLHRNLMAARWYAQRIGYTSLYVDLARENQTVEL
jgi:phosphoribosyl 1,2-cyclic phosphodiesterase